MDPEEWIGKDMKVCNGFVTLCEVADVLREIGGLDIFNDFPFIDAGKPDGTPSTNFIRVEGGKLRYIHENTVCTTKNCGR